MRISLIVLVLVGSGTALAGVPLSTAHAKLEGSHVSSRLSLQSLGASVEVAQASEKGKPTSWGLDAFYLLNGGMVGISASHSREWWSKGAFHLTGQAGATLQSAVRGRATSGIGLQSAVYAGWGRKDLEGFGGASIGGELFTRSVLPKMVTRFVFGVRSRLGPVLLSGVLESGVDFQVNYLPTFRGDALVLAGWAF